MKIEKSKKLKKWITIATSAALAAGSLASMGYGIYYQVENTTKSNDFDSGRSLQFQLRLYETNSDGSPVLNDGNLVPLYSDAEESKNLKISAEALSTILRDKKVNNIRVSFGYGYATNHLFPDQKEKVGILYADFENAPSAFDLKDIEESVNQLYNNEKIYSALSTSTNYELDAVEFSYNSSKYPVSNQLTGRSNVGQNNSGLFYNKDTSVSSGKNLNLLESKMLNGEIAPYKHDGLEGDYVAATAKETFNAWAFALDKQVYDSLPDGGEEGGGEEGGETYRSNYNAALSQSIRDANYQDQEWYNNPSLYNNNSKKDFQTSNTWILWKDKQGLINHLNSLLTLWYYNLYANKIPDQWADPSYKTIDQVFKISDKYDYNNHVDPETRNQINVMLDHVTTAEKSFIAMCAQMSGAETRPTTWRPEPITEEDLIPVLYNYYNSEAWNSGWEDPAEMTDVSQSVLNGWGWLESDKSSMSSLIGDYIVGKIDYRNYKDYLFNTEKDDEATKEFTTDKFLFKSEGKPKDYSKKLNSGFKFKIINSYHENFMDSYQTLDAEIQELSSRAPDFSNPDSEEVKKYKEERKTFAERNFSGSDIFGSQYTTKSTYNGSWTKMNPLDILLIMLGVIVFAVGIFVSIRYRVPGIIAAFVSSSVFVLGATLFSAFGFVLSFYGIMALATGVGLSLLTPLFFFRNVKKELGEKSSMTGSVVKTLKKYWKMSLDIHMISLLTSLSFLFFGSGGNIALGAMLVISVFLSFILSGVIFYILLFMYTQFTQINSSKFFFDNKLYDAAIMNKEPTRNKFFNFFTPVIDKLKFYNRWTHISGIVFLVISLIGIIVISTAGSVASVDFNDSNILVIKNFDTIGLSKDNIINAIGANVFNSYVFNNQLFIFTRSNLEITSIVNGISGLTTDQDIQALIASSTSFTKLTTDFSKDIIANTAACIGIALGFTAIWAVLSLNIVSVLPLIVSQLFSIGVVVGILGIIQIPVNLEVIPVIVSIFLITSIISTSVLSVLKKSWDRSLVIDLPSLKNLSENIISKINVNFWYFGAGIIAFCVLSFTFASTSLMLSFVLLIFATLWMLVFTNRIVVNMWFVCIKLRDKFNKELIHSEKVHRVKLEYDEVDEQIITGINN
ncbi:MAG: hypothetical protein ACRC4M_03870 [Mycoplasma sp.]